MKVALAALMMATGAALDLATKAWARSSLEPYGPASDFLPFVSLRLTFNEGVSFSMLAFEGESGQALLLGATGLLTLILYYPPYQKLPPRIAAFSKFFEKQLPSDLHPEAGLI